MSGEGLRSGQVAAAAGVNLQTLRYYGRRGLLDEPVRTLGGHRLYPAEVVTTLQVIKAAQRLGFTLAEVSELLDTARHRHGLGEGAGLQARARDKLADVEAKIADLAVIAETLRTAIAAGCDDLQTCAGDPDCPIPFPALAADSNHRTTDPGAGPAESEGRGAGPRDGSQGALPWAAPGRGRTSARIGTRTRPKPSCHPPGTGAAGGHL
jgi:DNA-binding transcriptional MerR regulator